MNLLPLNRLFLDLITIHSFYLDACILSNVGEGRPARCCVHLPVLHALLDDCALHKLNVFYFNMSVSCCLI